MALTNSRISGAITLLITIFSLSISAHTRYSGCTGEPDNQNQIAKTCEHHGIEQNTRRPSLTQVHGVCMPELRII